MAFTYVIDSANRLVRVTWSGLVRGADIGAVIRAIYEDPAWQPDFDTLWDGNGVTELVFEAEDMKNLIAIHRSFSAKAATGREIIVARRQIDYVMAQMYSMMMRDVSREVSVCRSMTEGLQLLGRPI